MTFQKLTAQKGPFRVKRTAYFKGGGWCLTFDLTKYWELVKDRKLRRPKKVMANRKW